MKKTLITTVLASGLTAALVFSSAYAVGPTFFNDEYKFANWNEAAIRELSAEGIMTGYPNGSYGPDKNITRAEVAVALDRLLKKTQADYVTVGEMQGVLLGQEKYGNAALGTFEKHALILASAGVSKMTTAPSITSLTKISFPAGVTDGYTIYSGTISTRVVYYVNFQNTTSASVHVNNWFGPF